MPHLILIFLQKDRVIITIVCSYNFYYALENLIVLCRARVNVYCFSSREKH